MKSWKIGAIAGLIAGIVLGILSAYLPRINYSIGLWTDSIGQAVSNSIVSNILISIIFGIILGVIFSKVHSVIPGRVSLKGPFFGLIIFLIYAVRDSTFMFSYGYVHWGIGDILFGFFRWIPYGLVLGVLYNFLCSKYSIKDLKIKKYSLIGGIHIGAIAGIADGLAAFAPNIIGPLLGLFLWGGTVEIGSAMPNLDLIVGQFGAHIFINMLWGVVFGVIFVRVYDLVPNKGVLKGITYSLIIFLITSFQSGIMNIGWGLSSSLWFWISAGIWSIFVGFFSTGVALGLVLGLLYRKSTK